MKTCENGHWTRAPKMSTMGKFQQFFGLSQKQKECMTGWYLQSVEFGLMLKSFLLEVFTNSSVHGFNHVVAPARHFTERIFWVVVEILALIAMLSTIRTVLLRFDISPTVISMERDYLAWNTSFPTATICIRELNTSQINQVLGYFKIEDSKLLRRFLVKISNLTMANLQHHDLTDHPTIPPNRYVRLLNMIQLSFNPQILTSVEGQAIPLQKTMTELGLCYAVNSKIAIYNSPKYWESHNWSIIEQKTLYGHPLDGDLFVQLSNFNQSYTIYFHGPRETPEMTNRPVIGPPFSFRTIVLKVLSFYSKSGVRSLSFFQRRCRFLEERVLKRSPIYSYNLCLAECRAEKIIQLCGCLPHFYRPLSDERVCSISELACVRDHLPALTTINQRLKNASSDPIDGQVCTCAQTCDGDIFTIYDNQFMLWDRSTQIKYGFRDYPKMRLKRDIMFGFTDVLGCFGGAAGLFFGCSILTFVEIIYFLVVRVYRFCRKGSTINI